MTAILFGVLIGGLLVLVSGASPLEAYAEIVTGALLPDNLPNTLNWAVPLVGMTLVAAIPLRGGMINLGGDGQMVIGGLVAALIPLYLPAPGPILLSSRSPARRLPPASMRGSPPGARRGTASRR